MHHKSADNHHPPNPASRIFLCVVRKSYFEVNPQTSEMVDGRLRIYPEPRGLEITVYERPFLTRKEWDRRYASSTNLMAQYMEMARTNHSFDTNHPIDTKTAELSMAFLDGFGSLDLPGWHYQNVGVQVHIQEVDVVYPGLKKDIAEAQKRYGRIVALLKPYQPTPTKP
jgi:hypothetical protein